MQTAILSNINLAPLKSSLPRGEQYFCGYGAYMEELIDKDSYVNKNNIDIFLLHIEGEEFIKEIINTLIKTSESKKMIGEKLDTVLKLLENYAQKNQNTSVIITTFFFPSSFFVNYLDLNSEYSFSALEQYINERIVSFAKKFANVYILDWKRIVALYGYKAMIDEKYWYLGRIKYTNKGYEALGLEIRNMVKAIKGETKKVLVLDLDNTLWGGVIGEDGLGGIALSEDGLGKAFRDFQYTIKSLKDLGVLIAINSKNNHKDVEDVFKEHPAQILKKEDFVSIKVNWNDKVENMKEIAQELNLGLDSFVFIDDNPIERKIVKEYLPEITVPDFPEDVAYLKTWFIEEIIYQYFPKVFITSEDRQKLKQYQGYISRGKLAKELDMDKFIESLEIKLGFYLNDKRFVTRTAQLTQKTNQFNMTTRRYTEADIEKFVDSKDTLVFNCEYEDKFGFEGIIAAAILKQNNDYAYVDTFLMSCRTIGRKVEYNFFYKIMEYLTQVKFKRIEAEFCLTQKNIVAKDFYQKLGFCEIKQEQDSIYYRDDISNILKNLEKNKCVNLNFTTEGMI